MRLVTVCLLLTISTTVFSETNIPDEIKKVITRGENDFFVHIGTKTRSILTQRAESINNCLINMNDGDVPPPIGNGQAEMYAEIACQGYSTIGLRLKRADVNHYHILGFWTLNGL